METDVRGPELRRVRELCRVSRAELARRSGRSAYRIGQIELERTRWSTEEVRWLLVTLWQLVDLRHGDAMAELVGLARRMGLDV